ncbi:class I SAM-dependent methyltransferase [Aliikangiella coralliicola]|uniref:SAM-dependent methyltransferase n=1 Tax=Aliikangiella coralliicola TaxID=2592383 RepID=A0A545UE08_9GAMM|nr:SAM-dependent methyltransferase [Aliikangiella coralliicola]TQV87705.1 SAM-dependent methyltransferase [Aliikangiella coralliicola]
MQQKKISVSHQALCIHHQLVDEIRVRIEQNGGMIHFQEFMQLALYKPGLGYYQNPVQKFGEQGDFVTAPEMGNHFANCLARSIAELQADNRNQLLEIGAGSGALAVELLSSLAKMDLLPQKYLILEPSANLQALQKRKVSLLPPEIAAIVEWLPDLPENFTGTAIANEVIDAIPCERIVKTESGWKYQGVTWQENAFQWHVIENHGTQALEDMEAFPQVLSESSEFQVGYVTETRPMANSWIERISRSIDKGWILLFDYGYPQQEYYHPQRIEGSLRCFSRHQANSNPLELVGLQDITAHVDFTELANAAVSCGLEVSGFTTQSGFLIENGILEVEHSANQVSTDSYINSQQIQKLIAPGQMGEVVKVIALSKEVDDQPGGFGLQDHLHRL